MREAGKSSLHWSVEEWKISLERRMVKIIEEKYELELGPRTFAKCLLF